MDMLNRDIKITMRNMLKDLVEKPACTQRRSNYCEETTIIRKSQMEISETKHYLNELINRLDTGVF